MKIAGSDSSPTRRVGIALRLPGRDIGIYFNLATLRLETANTVNVIFTWLFAVLSVVACIWIGLLLVWDRGLYMDDYSFRSAAQNLTTATWQPLFEAPAPHVRILGQIVGANLASAIPTHEFAVRLVWALVHGANAFLVGRLMFRITGSPFAGFIAMLLYLTPFPSHEAVLWHIQGVHQVSTFCFLIAIHLFLTVVESHSRRLSLTISGCIWIALGLQFSELPVPAIGLLIPVALAATLRPGVRHEWRRYIYVAFGLALTGLIVCIVHYILFTSRSYTVDVRGGLSLNPLAILANYTTYIKRLYWLTLAPDWGGPLTRDSFALGLATLAETKFGGWALLLLVVSSAIWLYIVPLPTGDPKSTVVLALALIALGLLWMFASLIPGAVLGAQILEWRMLYFALAGIAIAVASFIWGLLVLLQNRSSRVRRTLLTAPVCIAVWASITMLGYGQVYKLRSELDQRQIDALQSAVPPHSLKSDTTFIPIGMDFRIIRQAGPNLTPHDRLLFGVFEIPWAAEGALQMAYRRPDIHAVTSHHWMPGIRFGLATDGATGSKVLLANDHKVPLEKALAFTDRNGRTILLSPLVIVDADGQVQKSIDLPLAQAYKGQGLPLESIQVPALRQ